MKRVSNHHIVIAAATRGERRNSVKSAQRKFHWGILLIIASALCLMGCTTQPTATPVPPTALPSPTATARMIAPTAAQTREPFVPECASMSAGSLQFFENRVFFEISNERSEPMQLARVVLHWIPAADLEINAMALDAEIIWQGASEVSPTDTDSEGTWFDTAIATVFEQQTSTLQAVLNIGFLSSGMQPSDFYGTKLYFRDGLGEICYVWLNVPLPSAPSGTPTPS